MPIIMSSSCDGLRRSEPGSSGTHTAFSGFASACGFVARGLQQIFERRQRLDDEEHLIREESTCNLDQRVAGRHHHASEDAVTEHERERPWNATDLTHSKSALFEQSTKRGKGEQPRMRHVQDALLAVVELPEE